MLQIKRQTENVLLIEAAGMAAVAITIDIAVIWNTALHSHPLYLRFLG